MDEVWRGLTADRGTEAEAGQVLVSPGDTSDPARIQVYDAIDALPKPALHLLEEEGRARFMNGLHWYHTFATTCLDAGQTPRFYLVTSKDDLLIMPMITPLGRSGSRVSKRQIGPGTLMAMTNHQTLIFAPISNVAGDQLAGLLEAFARHLKQEGVAVVDLNHLEPGIADTGRLAKAFDKAGFSTARYHDQTVVFDALAGLDFATFLKNLSSNLRGNLKRRRKKLEQMGTLRFVMVQGGPDLAETIRDYEIVQNASWKPDEIYPDHVPALIQAAAAAGSLRLSVLYLDDRPVATDLSFVSAGRANGHKAHYDQAFRQHGVGEIMTTKVLEHLIDTDRVEEIDFGKNADTYKLRWLKQLRPLDGLVAFNPATVDGQIKRLLYHARTGSEAQLSALKRRIEGTKLAALISTAKNRLSRA